MTHTDYSDWIEWREEDGNIYAIGTKNEDVLISFNHELEDAQRYARLVFAAPDLLEALENSVIYLRDLIEFSESRGLRNIGAVNAIEKVNAAIKAARP